MSTRLKSQETIRRQAQKDLLKLREEVASAKSLSTSANKSAEKETTSLAKVSLHHIIYHMCCLSDAAAPQARCMLVLNSTAEKHF